MFERGLSPTHLLLLLLIILVLFGAKRVPDIARSLGRSLGEFKKGRAEGERRVVARREFACFAGARCAVGGSRVRI